MQQRLQPLVALRAIRRLIADPEQTQEVFTIIRALSGPALRDGYQRFAETETGKQVLRGQRSLLDTLSDQDHLEQLPADSLGRHYLGYLRSEGLTATGLVDASNEDDYDELGPNMALFARRQRDMHDLWHALSQYGRDELGEALLLAFTYAQTKNRGIGFICFVGLCKLAEHYGAGVFSAGWRAYRDGKRAAWLPAQDWETLLTLPIEDVRRQLRLPEPDLYWNLQVPSATAV